MRRPRPARLARRAVSAVGRGLSAVFRGLAHAADELLGGL